MTHTIDAQGNSLGRVASSAARILMGKNSPQYASNKVLDQRVEIINASKAKIGEKEMSEKVYETYSGYPGGMKETTLEKLIEKKGYSEAFKVAVYGMLPNNRLRKELMKRLKVTE